MLDRSRLSEIEAGDEVDRNCKSDSASKKFGTLSYDELVHNPISLRGVLLEPWWGTFWNFDASSQP